MRRGREVEREMNVRFSAEVTREIGQVACQQEESGCRRMKRWL